MNFRIFETKEQLIAGAAEAIARHIELRDRSIIGLSGGSTPQPIYRNLSARLDGAIASKDVTWLIVDERDVDEHHPDSNAAMIRRTLFPNGAPAAHRFITYAAGSTLSREQVAANFEREVTGSGIVSPTLITLGMGDDGHTASLFPSTAALAVTDRIAVPNEVPQLGTWRYTLSIPFIRASEEIFVIVSGGSKKEMLHRIHAGERLPVALATEGHERCWWFVDREVWPETSTERRLGGESR